jgi:hypothetical protein
MPAKTRQGSSRWSRWKNARRDAQNAPNTWRSAPMRTRILFLLAVFSTFVGIGIAVDISNLGREPLLRAEISVVLTGVFSVGYAVIGVIFRGKSYKGIVPLFIVHFFVMLSLRHMLPDPPDAADPNAAVDTARLSYEGLAVILSSALGYAGLVYVSVSEAKRFAAAQTEKARLESEISAAREVQRMMVPESLPAIPGYAIQSVYRPATEVSGDFFQLIPLKSGKSLAVIGDVSGKGMSAAMVVSMIVGMLCIICTTTEEPGEILAELNRRLCNRIQSGFATCLAIRLDSGGQLVLATAGHPAPYLNGREVSLSGSMPLGMNHTEVYKQTTLEMHSGDTAVLLTDGILEASTEDGVLFGFSRVESLLHDGASAAALADAAQQHGQNDDLTVVAISRKA